MPVMTKNNSVCVCACVTVHGVCSQMFYASVKNSFLHLKKVNHSPEQENLQRQSKLVVAEARGRGEWGMTAKG